MKATIKTEKLKNLIAKAVNGAGNNKMWPITSLVEIRVYDHMIQLTTTTVAQYLYVKDTVLQDDGEFSIVIELSKFAKLISKMTCETVELEVKDRYLEVRGNGVYKLELPLDENGLPISYPTISESITDTMKIRKSIVEVILNTCKPSLATTLEVPVYTNYYFGDIVIATNTMQIASLKNRVFKSNILISPELFDLLSVMDDEEIEVSLGENNFVRFVTKNVQVIGKLEDGIEDYAVDAITELLTQKFNNVCKFSKADMVSTLERIALFVGAYDERAIRLTFDRSGITVESKVSDGVETIKYSEEPENIEPFSCLINVDMFLSQLKANYADIIELHFGEENSIKLVDGAITQVIALLEE